MSFNWQTKTEFLEIVPSTDTAYDLHNLLNYLFMLIDPKSGYFLLQNWFSLVLFLKTNTATKHNKMPLGNSFLTE